jgi:hypothetical protein
MNQGLTKQTYESTYVAFLDILGFKDIVLGHSHEHLESLYLRTLCGTFEHAMSNGKYVLVSDGENECLGPDIRQATVNSLLVSDSILIWTDDCRTESFINIVTAVRNLIAFSVIDRILLRGAIAVGPLTVVLNQLPSQTHSFQHSLFGKAIVDAVQAEKSQDWAGCMITEPAMECFKTGCAGEKTLIEKKVIAPYSIPMKGGIEASGYVIDWVNHPQAGIDAQTVTGAFEPKPSIDQSEFEKIKIKLANTLKFVRHVKPSADKQRWPLGQFAH